MADILLTHSNHLYSDRKQVRKMQPYPPLQTLMAAALLRERGYSVALCDVTLAASIPNEEFQARCSKPSAAAGGGGRRQFQLPDQDVPDPQPGAGVSDVRRGATRRAFRRL